MKKRTIYPHQNFLNKRNGRLLVIKQLEENLGRKNNGGKYICLCDCQNKIEIFGYQLKDRMSCGCLIKEHAIKQGIKNRKPKQVTINKQYLLHKESARGRNFTPLTKEYWYSLVFLPCYYCNSIDERNYARLATHKKTRAKYKGIWTKEIENEYSVFMNGIDRKNPDIGYEKDNSISCCKMCNYMKRDWSKEEFLSKIKQIYNHLNLDQTPKPTQLNNDILQYDINSPSSG